MALTRGNILTTVKYLLRESNTLNLTYSATELNNYFYEALKNAVKECRWPEITATGSWSANTQEISIPDGIIEILRVYINGQRIPPTNIPELEEDWKRNYDASWTVKSAVTIPELATANDTSLATIGSPNVKYYIRGVKIGLTPKPAVLYAYRFDCLKEPTNPASDDTTLDFFSNQSDYLVYATLKYCMLADRKFEAAEKYERMAIGEAIKLRRQIKILQGDAEEKVNVLPYREYWGR